jgi:hypothetical protein
MSKLSLDTLDSLNTQGEKMDRLKQAEQEGQQQKLLLWAKRIRECRASGLAVISWCEQNNLTRQTYYYWMRKIKREFVDALPEHKKYEATSIIPVEKPAPPRGWAICETADENLSKEVIDKKSITIKVGKCQVDVTPDSDPKLLSNVLKVLVTL